MSNGIHVFDCDVLNSGDECDFSKFYKTEVKLIAIKNKIFTGMHFYERKLALFYEVDQILLLKYYHPTGSVDRFKIV